MLAGASRRQTGRALRAGPYLFRILVPLAALFVVASWTKSAHAYAWMIRHGYGGCNVCHADPSGGELLTAYGRAQGDLLLRMRYGKDTVSGAASETSGASTESFDDFDDFDSGESEAGDGKESGGPVIFAAKKGTKEKADTKGEGESGKATKKEDDSGSAGDEASGPSPSAGFLWGLITPPDWMLLGGSYRHLLVYKNSKVTTFPMQADFYGQVAFGAVRAAGSIGIAKVKPGSPHARAAQVTTNQGDQMNLISRNYWLAFDFGAQKAFTARVGRLNLPFGVRIPEHTMWVREATRTDRESDQQHGVALAYNGPKFRGEAMAIAGNYQVNPDRYRERGYSLFIETLVTEPFATGVSSLMTVAQSDISTLEEEKTVRGAHGIFTRLKISEPLVVLAEADALHKSRRDLGYAAFLQLDYEAVQGLHFGGTGEVLDSGYERAASNVPGIDVARSPGFGKPQLGGWLTVDWFFLPHLEARVDAVFRQDNPFTLLGQLHAYL